MRLNPYIKPKFSNTSVVMLDVIIALLPLSIISYVAYGMQALQLQLVAIGAALLTEMLSALLFTKNYKSILDGSAIVTALLMCFTISPLTPWYIVAFGAASAILFGKIAWGGLGKNRFNPALVGREFMAAFFPAIMTSATIWLTQSIIVTPATDFFPGLTDDVASYLSGIIFKPNGAMGEYSIAAIAVGGLYLLIRNRISWHIPFGLLTVLLGCCWIAPETQVPNFSMAGVLLGTIFMATDMPSSPTNPNGKLYYGGMIGLVTFLLLLGKVSYEYMSFSILILNGFSYQISEVFKPRVWGQPLDWQARIEKIFLLTLSIVGVTAAIITLNYYHLTVYLIYVYLVYIIFKFNFSFLKNISNPI